MTDAYVSSYTSKEQAYYLSLLSHGEQFVTIPMLIVATYKRQRQNGSTAEHSVLTADMQADAYICIKIYRLCSTEIHTLTGICNPHTHFGRHSRLYGT
jgi:hypothetical protein